MLAQDRQGHAAEQTAVRQMFTGDNSRIAFVHLLYDVVCISPTNDYGKAKN